MHRDPLVGDRRKDAGVGRGRAALVVLGLLVLLMIWLIPKVWRFLRAIVARILGIFGPPPARGDPTRRSADV